MSDDFPYEREQRRNERWTAVLAATLYGVCLYLGCRNFGTVAGVIYSSPMLGAFVAWMLVYRGGNALLAAKWLALRKVDGARHYFDDQPIQIEWHEGRARIGALTIFAVLREAPSPTLLRRLQLQLGEQGFGADAQGQWWFDEDALLQWLHQRAQSADRGTLRLERWLRHEALPALHRKADPDPAGVRNRTN